MFRAFPFLADCSRTARWPLSHRIVDGLCIAPVERPLRDTDAPPSRRDAPPERFAELARELSNCPSGARGGDLGWLTPEDCAEELAGELFDENEPLRGMGLHPRLVHSRFGFHIVDVLGRKKGRAIPFEEVRERIAGELAQRSRATGLHQYIRVLAGQARIEGIDLEAAASPLVQ